MNARAVRKVDAAPQNLAARIDSLDWARMAADLNAHGCATTGVLLNADECLSLRDSYDSDALFRSRVVMAALRECLFPPLADIANAWNADKGQALRYPREHQAYLARCHKAGQCKPTPLLLAYSPGDYNCLHQDLYGELVFPLQVAFLLSRPGHDFTGGEFVLTEQRPRMQSRAEVVPLQQGEGVVFPVHHRPVRGSRGAYRVNMRHGVSRLRSGHRHTLCIIFHDAE
jgi:hypothetical protein